MDERAKQIIEVLKKYLGDAAGLYFLREQKWLKLEKSINLYSEDDKEKLISAICRNILQKAVSPQKLSIIRSRLYSILDLDDAHDNMMEIEGIGW